MCSQPIGQGLLVYALGHVPPLVVGIAMLTQPALSAALLGWLYYGEALTGRDWLGAAQSLSRWCWSAGAERRTRLRTNPSRRPIVTAMSTPAETLRLKLALPVGGNAAFDGWNGKAVDSAAAQIDVDPAQARLAFPKEQPAMVRCLYPGRRRGDGGAFHAEEGPPMKIRDRSGR